MAKGITNGAVPLGAVATSGQIHNALMQGPEAAIELFHGYTYSGHPVACAAGLATLDIYAREGLLNLGTEFTNFWSTTLFDALADAPHVIDVRTIGLTAAIEFAPRNGASGERGYDVFVNAFENGMLVRATGDILALSPPLIISKIQIEEIAQRLRAAVDAAA